MTRADIAVLPRVLLPAGVVLLVLGVGGGLARFGVDLGASHAAMSAHGALVVFGFFGMLVSLERGVVVRRGWVSIGPLCALAGSVLVLAGAPNRWAAAAWVGAAVLTLLIILAIGRAGSAGPTIAHEQMLGGCIAWVAGATLWGADASLAIVVPFLTAFLLLTIVGERTQLGKLAHLVSTRRVARSLLALLAVALVVMLVDVDLGSRCTGAVLVAYGVWLLRVDARSRLRRPGLMRYLRLTVIGGLVWLVVAGLLLLQQGALASAPGSDAAIHAFFMGFVMSMVFAHAPMVFPAITRIRVPYYRAFAVPVVLMHLTLVVRIVGDLSSHADIARIGAIGTTVSIALFLLAVASSALAALAGYAPARPTRRGPANT